MINSIGNSRFEEKHARTHVRTHATQIDKEVSWKAQSSMKEYTEWSVCVGEVKYCYKYIFQAVLNEIVSIYCLPAHMLYNLHKSGKTVEFLYCGIHDRTSIFFSLKKYLKCF